MQHSALMSSTADVARLGRAMPRTRSRFSLGNLHGHQFINNVAAGS